MQFRFEGTMTDPLARRQGLVEGREGAVDIAGARFGFGKHNLDQPVGEQGVLLAQKFDPATCSRAPRRRRRPRRPPIARVAPPLDREVVESDRPFDDRRQLPAANLVRRKAGQALERDRNIDERREQGGLLLAKLDLGQDRLELGEASLRRNVRSAEPSAAPP